MKDLGFRVQGTRFRVPTVEGTYQESRALAPKPEKRPQICLQQPAWQSLTA